jgi:hypothetical protein
VTAPRSRTASSTLRLSEFARYFVFPPEVKRTVFTRVEAKGKELGVGFDWWQSQLGTVCLGYGADGRYCATVGGIGLSIPRQVGKTYFVLALLVIMCILFPGLQVVWSAHHLRTSTKTFTTLRGIARRKKIAPHILGTRAANGEQQVEFRNGSMIMFGSRKMGFGRGFDEIDVEVFDEAQILDMKSLEDMVAATNQARHEHGALLFFMGTPPRPTDPSDAFVTRRAKAINGKTTNAVWLEISAKPGSHPDDRSQWPVMNPSYPKHTPAESLERLRENLDDVDSWNREGRGIWDEDDLGWRVFSSVSWKARKRTTRKLAGTPSLALAASPDLALASIGAANVDGSQTWGKLLAHGAGVGWVVDQSKAFQERHQSPLVVDKSGPCSSLIEELQSAGVRLRLVGSADTADAEALLYQLVQERGTFRDASSPALSGVLTESARIAQWRPMGDRRVLDRKVGDLTSVESVALAVADAMANAYDVEDSFL